MIVGRMVRSLNPNAKCPSRQGVKERMLALKAQLQNQMMDATRDEHITLTSDTWTSRSNDTFLGVTCHWIDSDWKLRKMSVDCEKLTGSTTADELSVKVPAAWGRHPAAGIVANVGDGEPSMVAMGRKVEEMHSIPFYTCTDHRLELTCGKFYKDENVDMSMKKIKAMVTDIHKSSQVSTYAFCMFIMSHMLLIPGIVHSCRINSSCRARYWGLTTRLFPWT